MNDETTTENRANGVGSSRLFGKWWAFGWSGAVGHYTARRIRGEVTKKKVSYIEKRARIACKRWENL